MQQFVRQEFAPPKSRAGRRVLELGAHAAAALEEQYRATRHRAADCIVSPIPLSGRRLTVETDDLREDGAQDGKTCPRRSGRGMGCANGAHRDRAAGVPGMFVQAKAGHAQGSTTKRYLHAHRTSYPAVADLAEARLFTPPTPEVDTD